MFRCRKVLVWNAARKFGKCRRTSGESGRKMPV